MTPVNNFHNVLLTDISETSHNKCQCFLLFCNRKNECWLNVELIARSKLQQNCNPNCCMTFSPNQSDCRLKVSIHFSQWQMSCNEIQECFTKEHKYIHHKNVTVNDLKSEKSWSDVFLFGKDRMHWRFDQSKPKSMIMHFASFPSPFLDLVALSFPIGYCAYPCKGAIYIVNHIPSARHIACALRTEL